MWVNKNANNPNVWSVDFDLSQPAFTDTRDRNEAPRLTWQASQRHKLTFYWQEQHNYIGKEGGGTPTQTPEGTGLTSFTQSRVQQGTWTFAINNKLLAEAGIGTFLGIYDQSGGGGPRIGGIGGVNNPAMIQQLEQSGAIIPSCNCSIPGLISRHPGLAQRRIRQERHRDARMAGLHVVCQRRAQHEVRLPGRVQHADQELLLRQHRHPGPDEQRGAQSDHPEPRLPRLAPHRPPRHPRQPLRAGSVDAEAADAAGRRAVRQRHHALHLRPDRRPSGLSPHADAGLVSPRVDPGDRLEGHHPPSGRGLRSVRERQDRRQGERRQIHGGAQFAVRAGHEPDLPHSHHDDTAVAESHQFQFHQQPGLQSREPGGAARLRAGGQSNLRDSGVQHQLRPRHGHRLGKPSRTSGPRACRCSRSSCPVWR